MDASFAGVLDDSNSTKGPYLCIVGPRTFVPITWVCKRQTAVSHSSTEAEVISLDAALRMEGLPSVMLWELVMEVFGDPKSASNTPVSAPKRKAALSKQTTPQAALFNGFVENLDFIPCTIPRSSGLGNCIIFEHNDAVIKQCIKGRSPAMRHSKRPRNLHQVCRH